MKILRVLKFWLVIVPTAFGLWLVLGRPREVRTRTLAAAIDAVLARSRRGS